MTRRLGKGLGSLLGANGGHIHGDQSPESDQANQASLGDSANVATGGHGSIPIKEIFPNPHQPRKHFEPEALEELSASINNHGVLQPIAVRRAPGNRFEIIAGERRWRAAQAAGLESIPAVIREDVDDNLMLELALIENVQRRDLNPLERAEGYQRLVAVGLSQEQVAQKVGLKRTTVANHIRLLELAPKVREAVAKELLSMGHARALLGLRDFGAQLTLAERIVREDLSVRAVEKIVREHARPSPPPPQPQSPSSSEAAPPWIKDLERRIGDQLGTRVTVRNSPGYRGQIVIDYFSREDLERLISNLAPRPVL